MEAKDDVMLNRRMLELILALYNLFPCTVLLEDAPNPTMVSSEIRIALLLQLMTLLPWIILSLELCTKIPELPTLITVLLIIL
jgi:hypothetical protein